MGIGEPALKGQANSVGGRQPAPHQKGGAGSYICVRVRFSVHVCVCVL